MHSSRIISGATLLLISGLLFAYAGGDLGLYIHPRYIQFTVYLTVAGFMVLSIATLGTPHAHDSASSWGSRASIALLCVVAFFAVGIQPTSLSQQIAQNRATNSQVQADTQLPSSIDILSKDLSRFSIADWANMLANAPAETQIVGKKAKLTGFILEGNEGQRFIARFKITCCAVDVTPLTVPLQPTQVVQGLPAGQWVSLEGVFNNNASPEYPYQLSVDTLQPIDEPKDPYVF